jgi:Bacterial Ig-like domain
VSVHRFRVPLAALTASVALLVFAPGAFAATFTVNDTGDAHDFDTAAPQPNDGVCDTDATPNGDHCTLRAAINEANANNNAPGVVDTINFAASFDGGATGGAVADTIVGTGPGENIDEATLVDATDCAATPDPCAGFQAAGGNLGLQVSGNNVEIRGLAITSGSTGLTVQGDNAKVAGNWFGLRLDETAQGNGRGVELASNVAAGNDQNTVGGETAADRNVFANNSADGVRISGADGNVIKGNYFGTKPDGTTAAANGAGAGGDNIEISSVGGTANPASNNAIGGAVSAAQLASPECDGPCNVIANSTDGVDLETEGGTEGSPAGPTSIKGNFVGLDKNGATAAPNTGRGINVGPVDGVTIGGSSAVARNYITGGTIGILQAEGVTSHDLTVQNNFVGLSSDGSVALSPPTQYGVVLGGNLAEPSSALDNRLVGHPTMGIVLWVVGSGTTVRRNVIGIDAQGDDIVGGEVGIDVTGSGNTIGGSTADGNTIGNATLTAGAATGMQIGGSDNTVQGNYVGTDQNGEDRGNGAGGILIFDLGGGGGDDNTIGGDTAATENVISNNGGDAIEIFHPDGSAETADRNVIARNRGSNNDGLFIDLKTAGLTGTGDGFGNPPDGPNGGIDNPDIDAGATSESVSGTADPGATVRVYRTDSADGTDPNGIVAFVGETTADGSGDWALSCPGAGCAAEPPGPGRFTANQTDASDNSSELAKAESYTAVPPDTTITSGPTQGSTINDPTPTFGFSSEAGATFECRVDSGSFGPCADSTGPTGSHTTPQLSDGQHTFEVRATDAANTGAAVTRTFTVDTTAQTTITSGPAQGSSINDPTPTFAFSSEAGATFQCKVDGGSFAGCSSPKTTAALSDGSHTFQVRATDPVANVDPTPASRTFTVDTTSLPSPTDTDSPETTIDKGPKKKSHKRKAKFRFSSDEPGSSFECKLDRKPFKACDSPFKKKVKPRKHKFRVRAIDQAGNVDATPAKKKFKVLG